MVVEVFKSNKLYVASYDLSSDIFQIELASQRAKKDKTVFGDDTEHSIPGLFQHTLNHQGYHQADANDFQVDDILDSLNGSVDDIVTVCPTGGAAGELAYFLKSMETEYGLIGQVGEIFAFRLSAEGVSEMVRGTVMNNSALTATGTGTARQLGAVTADQKVYAAMHVTAVSGTNPTLDMVLQSDDAEGMASATSRITFAQATAITSEWLTADGPITDDWWLPSFTVGGTDTPSFTVILVVGIQ